MDVVISVRASDSSRPLPTKTKIQYGQAPPIARASQLRPELALTLNLALALILTLTLTLTPYFTATGSFPLPLDPLLHPQL